MNGSEDVWPNIVASILEQIDYKNKETFQRLKALRPPIIRNAAGSEVGRFVRAFLLSNVIFLSVEVLAPVSPGLIRTL